MDELDGLERWAADARAREAAGARVRERWLRAQAEEGASLGGLFLALAERRETVVVTTTAAVPYRGAVVGVGEDFVAIEALAGTTTVVALAAVALVRVVGPGRRPAPPTTGAAPSPGALGVRLADLLGQAAGQRPRISVQSGTAAMVGDLRGVGDDVLPCGPTAPPAWSTCPWPHCPPSPSWPPDRGARDLPA